MVTPHKIAEELVIDTGFSRTVNEKWECGDENGKPVFIWRQVYSDYSYSLDEEGGEVFSATSFTQAIEKAHSLCKNK